MQTINRNPIWWRRRAASGICCSLVFAFTYMAIIVPATATGKFLFRWEKNAKETNPAQGVCLTAECIRTAWSVQSKMRIESDPCNNFYQFACGKYIDETQIPADKTRMNNFEEINDMINQQLNNIIKEETPATSPKHLRLPNQLYKACMNEELIKALGTKPIKQISDSVGGWPVVVGDSWNIKNSWTWEQTVKGLKVFDPDYIIGFGVSPDFREGTKYRIQLDQPPLDVSREYLMKGIDDTLVSAYYDYMVDIAVLFGAEKAVARKELRESLQFEMDLANISWSSEARRNVNNLYNLRSVKELQESYPYVQWVDYINARLPEGVQIDENEVINLWVPSFFDDLGQLLQRTNKRAIANYIIWRIHSFSVDFLPEEFGMRKLQYMSDSSGVRRQQPRWERCTNKVQRSLGIAVGAAYVRKHFNQDSKAAALELVENLRSAFSEMLDEVKWMDDMTKQKAKQKLQAMIPYIGYPDELLDDEKLAEYYRELETDSNKYFESYLNISALGIKKQNGKLRLAVNKADWTELMPPFAVNAFYSPIVNSIQFPAGILQGHFFHSQRPKYMNYGAIGHVIGHEITHGFDDSGRLFDSEGNLVDWWQPDTEKAFLEKAKCIVEQYGNFSDKETGLNLNGKKTQGENIADNGGVKESYMAYNKWVAKNSEEPSLPGLNYTPNQMFWISAAQTLCAKLRKETLKLGFTNDVHSSNEYRVLGTFSNMKDFSRDFQCPEGTRMNPVKKCEVW